jgi:hypothetical protein
MIHHISIAAHHPQHVSEVLAEILQVNLYHFREEELWQHA